MSKDEVSKTGSLYGNYIVLDPWSVPGEERLSFPFRSELDGTAYSGRSFIMMFHVTYHHHPQNCPAAKGTKDPLYTETVGQLSADKVASGGETVKVLSSVASGPSHKIFLVVETDSLAALHSLLRPIKGVGGCEILPVGPLS